MMNTHHERARSTQLGTNPPQKEKIFYFNQRFEIAICLCNLRYTYIHSNYLHLLLKCKTSDVFAGMVKSFRVGSFFGRFSGCFLRFCALHARYKSLPSVVPESHFRIARLNHALSLSILSISPCNPILERKRCARREVT